VIGTGQSLAVGGTPSAVIVSVTQPHANLKLSPTSGLVQFEPLHFVRPARAVVASRDTRC
jgi:hypothetical protein